MKVITEKGGIKARSVNDRSIEHSIAEKTSLSKKNERELTGKAERTVHQADEKAKKAEQRSNFAPNRPPNAKGKPSGKPQTAPAPAPSKSADLPQSPQKTDFQQRHIGQHTGLQTEKSIIPESKSSILRKPPTAERKSVNTGLKTKAITDTKVSPTPFRPPKQYKLSPNVPKGKSYKVLKNGAVDNGGLTKKKERIIYSQQQKKQQLQNALQKKIDKPVTAPSERLPIISAKLAATRRTHIINRIKLNKFKLKRVKKQRIKLNRQQAAVLRSMQNKPVFFAGAKKAVDIAKKPIEQVKGQLLAQRPRTDKTEDSGTEAAKLGLQIADYTERGLKTSKDVVSKTADTTSKLAKRVYHKIHKPTSAELKRHLRKRTERQFSGQMRTLAKRAANNGAKTAAKATAKAAKATAKAAEKTAKAAAQAAQKAAEATAKAVTNTVARIASFIAETMPYSLIVIGVIIVVLVICLCMTEVIGGAGGSVAGGGAWLVDDEQSQTPEEIYEGYKEFIEQAKEVMETQAKDALKNEVTAFCASDTTAPRKIIQYIDKTHNRTFYPAAGADSTINSFIEQFGTDDYADYMSLLFVLMTREKQQADGVTDGEIYDFDFEKEDFEEFMKTVNENYCRWGDTFVIKTAIETYPEPCPGQNCKTKYLGDRCASYTDDEGHTHYFCRGHPYCPIDHTKLTVQLYTVKDYYDMDYPDIYDFTENEKARYLASKAIIQGLLDYWE